VRDLGAELVLAALQSFVGDRVPAAVVDRARGEQSDAERLLRGSGRGGRRSRFTLLAGSGNEKDGGKKSPFHGARILRVASSCGQWYTDSEFSKEEQMVDDIDRNDGGEFDEDDEQIEQMIIENGILLHSLAALLVRKGVLTQEEIDSEMDRLYDQMENFEQQ
jgi:hypothetical protein